MMIGRSTPMRDSLGVMLVAPACFEHTYAQHTRPIMQRRIRAAALLIVIVKAILITAAILFLGRFFGVNVREAGGFASAVSTCASETRWT